MKCYPVIYTRTAFCDYYTKFHVLPGFLDAGWLIRYIQCATSGLKPVDHIIKKIVVTDTDYCVFGVIAFASDVIDAGLSNYTCDEKGRAVYGFYGFSVQVTDETDCIPVFTFQDITNIYRRYIVPAWIERIPKTQEPVLYQLMEQQFQIPDDLDADYILNDSMNLFATEKGLFESILLRALNGDLVSYCSNLSDYQLLKQAPFIYAVTSINNLERLKIEEVQQNTMQTESVFAVNCEMFKMAEQELLDVLLKYVPKKEASILAASAVAGINRFHELMQTEDYDNAE